MLNSSTGIMDYTPHSSIFPVFVPYLLYNFLEEMTKFMNEMHVGMLVIQTMLLTLIKYSKGIKYLCLSDFKVEDYINIESSRPFTVFDLYHNVKQLRRLQEF